MGDVQIQTTKWRLVELGRVVVFTSGEFQGRLAAIVEIIDHKRVRFLMRDGAEGSRFGYGAAGRIG